MFNFYLNSSDAKFLYNLINKFQLIFLHSKFYVWYLEYHSRIHTYIKAFLIKINYFLFCKEEKKNDLQKSNTKMVLIGI